MAGYTSRRSSQPVTATSAGNASSTANNSANAAAWRGEEKAVDIRLFLRHASDDQVSEFTDVFRGFPFAHAEAHIECFFHRQQQRDVNERIPLRHILGR